MFLYVYTYYNCYGNQPIKLSSCQWHTFLRYRHDVVWFLCCCLEITNDYGGSAIIMIIIIMSVIGLLILFRCFKFLHWQLFSVTLYKKTVFTVKSSRCLLSSQRPNTLSLRQKKTKSSKSWNQQLMKNFVIIGSRLVCPQLHVSDDSHQVFWGQKDFPILNIGK